MVCLSRMDCFNTQPPEGGWKRRKSSPNGCTKFQHTAARRRLGPFPHRFQQTIQFQHTAARRRLGETPAVVKGFKPVSTHSRPKAAGLGLNYFETDKERFNTQPPEGGWGRPKGRRQNL